MYMLEKHMYISTLLFNFPILNLFQAGSVPMFYNAMANVDYIVAMSDFVKSTEIV